MAPARQTSTGDGHDPADKESVDLSNLAASNGADVHPAAVSLPGTGSSPVAALGRVVPLCVHLGMTKTATTLFQSNLFPGHSQVEYLGKFIKFSPYYEGRYHRDAGTKTIIEELLGPGALQANIPRCQKLISNTFNAVDSRRQIMVYSEEELCRGTEQLHATRARNLRAAFGACKVMITLRHPLHHLESEFFQALKRGVFSSQLNPRVLVSLASIRQRMRQVWAEGQEGDRGKLRYADLIAAYAAELGQDRVGVFLFEELVADPARYMAQVCKFLEIDHGEALNLYLGRRENDRWTNEQFLRIRFITRYWWRRWRFCRANLAERRALLDLDRETGLPLTPGPTARVNIPRSWRQRVEMETARGNRWLAEHWGLPLERLGYPM